MAASRSFQIDITHLQLIRNILKESNFNSNKWFDLGLSLRLPHSKLTEFETTTYANDASRCLRECLTLWLQSTGKPLPQLLANALEDIEEANAAKAISNILIDPASQILLKHFQHQNDLTLDDDIVTLLSTEGLMSKAVQQEMKRRGNLLVGEALRAICVTVAEEHSKLKVLADILLKSVETTTCGKGLIEDYQHQFPSTKEQLQTDEVTLTAEPTQLSVEEIHISQAHEYHFDAMRGKFGILCDKIIPILSNEISLEGLKKLLRRCYPELTAELSGAESIDDAMTVVEKQTNIINVAIIESIVDRYDVTKAKKLVTEYKEEIQRFSSNMKLHLVLNKKLSIHCSSLACETIKFVLDWEPSDHSLEDIRQLLEKAFDDLSRRVIVQSIHKTNSILIICYAPLYLINALLLEAQASLPTLIKEMGLIQLTVGYHSVYDRSNEKEKSDRNEESVPEDNIPRNNEESLLQCREENEHLKQALNENIEYIKALTIPASESELREKLLLKDKLKRATTLENEHLKSLVKSQAEEISILQEKITLLNTQILEWKEFIKQFKVPVIESSKEDLNEMHFKKTTVPEYKVIQHSTVEVMESDQLKQGDIELNPGPVTDDPKEVRRRIELCLQEQFADLDKATRHCISEIRTDLYSKGLITEPLRDSGTFNQVIDNVKAGLCLAEDVAQLTKRYRDFLACLSSQGGPCEEASKQLDEKLEEILKHKDAQHKDEELTLDRPKLRNERFKIERADEYEIKTKVTDLNKSLTKLLQSLKKELKEKDVDVTEIVEYLEDSGCDHLPFDDLKMSDNFREFLTKVGDYYDFLDCELLKMIAEEYASEELAKSFEAHSSEAQEFLESKSVHQLRECLQQIFNPYLDDLEKAPKVYIDLNSAWDKVTLNRLRILISCFFPDSDRHALTKHITVTCP